MHNYIYIFFFLRCHFKFSLGDFDPNIFPIPSSCLNPQDMPDHAKCQDPAPLALTPSPESMTADKDFFMALACLAARRSKDPSRQVIVYHHNYNIIIHACSHWAINYVASYNNIMNVIILYNL